MRQSGRIAARGAKKDQDSQNSTKNTVSTTKSKKTTSKGRNSTAKRQRKLQEPVTSSDTPISQEISASDKQDDWHYLQKVLEFTETPCKSTATAFTSKSANTLTQADLDKLRQVLEPEKVDYIQRIMSRNVFGTRMHSEQTVFGDARPPISFNISEDDDEEPTVKVPFASTLESQIPLISMRRQELSQDSIIANNGDLSSEVYSQFSTPPRFKYSIPPSTLKSSPAMSQISLYVGVSQQVSPVKKPVIEPPITCFIDILPVEIYSKISSYLPFVDLIRLSQTCSTLRLAIVGFDFFFSQFKENVDLFNVITKEDFDFMANQQCLIKTSPSGRMSEEEYQHFYVNDSLVQDWQIPGYSYHMEKRGYYRVVTSLAQNKCVVCKTHTTHFLKLVAKRICQPCLTKLSHVCCAACSHSGDEDREWETEPMDDGAYRAIRKPMQDLISSDLAYTMFHESQRERTEPFVLKNPEELLPGPARLDLATTMSRAVQTASEGHESESDDDDYEGSKHRQELETAYKQAVIKGEKVPRQLRKQRLKSTETINLFYMAQEYPLHLVPLLTAMTQFNLTMQELNDLPRISCGLDVYYPSRACWERSMVKHGSRLALAKALKSRPDPYNQVIPSNVADELIKSYNEIQQLLTQKVPIHQDLTFDFITGWEKQYVLLKKQHDVMMRVLNSLLRIEGDPQPLGQDAISSLGLSGDVQVVHNSDVGLGKSRRIDFLLGYSHIPNVFSWNNKATAIVANEDDYLLFKGLYPSLPVYNDLKVAIKCANPGDTIFIARGYEYHSSDDALENWKPLRLVGESEKAWCWRSVFEGDKMNQDVVVKALPGSQETTISSQSAVIRIPPPPRIHVDKNAGFIVELPISIENLYISSGNGYSTSRLEPRPNQFSNWQDLDHWTFSEAWMENQNKAYHLPHIPKISTMKPPTEDAKMEMLKMSTIVQKELTSRQVVEPRLEQGHFFSALTTDHMSRLHNCIIKGSNGSAIVARTPQARLIMTDCLLLKSRCSGLCLTRGASLVNDVMYNNAIIDNGTWGVQTDWRARQSLLDEWSQQNLIRDNHLAEHFE